MVVSTAPRVVEGVLVARAATSLRRGDGIGPAAGIGLPIVGPRNIWSIVGRRAAPNGVLRKSEGRSETIAHYERILSLRLGLPVI